MGFLSTFFGEIKAEEKCIYSDYDSFIKCTKNKSTDIAPKYPLIPFTRGQFEGFFPNFPIPVIGEPDPYLELKDYISLKAINNNKLEIKTKKKKCGFWGSCETFNENIFKINTKDIISWRYIILPTLRDWPTSDYQSKFELEYIDEIGNQKELFGYIWFRKDVSKYQINFFETVSNLKNGEKRDINKILMNKVKDNEKNITIISSIIKVKENQICLEVNETKFPDLINKYKNLSKTINPLRAKLDLPPSTEIKPICN